MALNSTIGGPTSAAIGMGTSRPVTVMMPPRTTPIEANRLEWKRCPSTLGSGRSRMARTTFMRAVRALVIQTVSSAMPRPMPPAMARSTAGAEKCSEKLSPPLLKMRRVAWTMSQPTAMPPSAPTNADSTA